jgi:hypothetical protein
MTELCRITSALMSYNSTHTRCAAISKFVLPDDGHDAQSWARSATREVLQNASKHELGQKDGSGLVDAIVKHIGLEELRDL